MYDKDDSIIPYCIIIFILLVDRINPIIIDKMYENPLLFIICGYEPLAEDNDNERDLLKYIEPDLHDYSYNCNIEIPNPFPKEDVKQSIKTKEIRIHPKPTAGWGNPTNIPYQ